jgi:hypothetical protein
VPNLVAPLVALSVRPSKGHEIASTLLLDAAKHSAGGQRRRPVMAESSPTTVHRRDSCYGSEAFAGPLGQVLDDNAIDEGTPGRRTRDLLGRPAVNEPAASVPMARSAFV